jgi:hypothetical protein
LTIIGGPEGRVRAVASCGGHEITRDAERVFIESEANAAFVASFNPKVAIALVDALIEAREALTALVELWGNLNIEGSSDWARARKALSTLNTLGDGHVG